MPAKTHPGKLLFPKILLAGFIAGTLDALAAIINYYIATGKNPVIVFVFISSGILGKAASSMPQSIAIVGLLLHFIIATIFSAFYFLIYPRLQFLRANRFLSAFLYGIFVWLVMNQVVVPLSLTPALPFHIAGALLAVAILIVCIGLPISFIAAAFYRKNAASLELNSLSDTFVLPRIAQIHTN